jgi:hypothetical protein
LNQEEADVAGFRIDLEYNVRGFFCIIELSAADLSKDLAFDGD